jgi:hypothetical protein
MLKNECISVLDKILYLNYEGQYCLWERLKILLLERKPPQIYCAKKIRTMKRSLLAHGALTVLSRYAHVKLMTRSRYAHGKLKLLSR